VTILIAFVGVIVAVLALGLGLFSGELSRIEKDPEFRKRLEQERKERERQRAWKDKLKD